MNVVVSGGNGQVGSELRVLAKKNKFKLIVLDRKALDITKAAQINAVFKQYQPNFFINAAAYTQVDRAEDDAQAAYNVNANALIPISNACNLYNCCLIHYSTDYVYNQKRRIPLKEHMRTQPKGIYAESKRMGERNIAALCNNYVIIRTSWVYSRYGKNFVDTMIRLSKTHIALRIVSDQTGAPTYARDIAVATLKVIENLDEKQDLSIQEIYNFSNAGKTNWADFARKIFSLIGSDCKVNNTTTRAYNARAHRPLWSVLSSAKIREAYKLEIPLWEDSLNDYLTSTGNIEGK